jgi:hypothetical protein
MNRAQAFLLAGLSLALTACSGWPGGMSFGLFDTAPAIPAKASIDLDSEPQGAEAKTSIGTSCQTPCTLEVPTSAGFSVTFTRDGYTPQTLSVQVQPGAETVKFAPNPVFAELAATKPSKKPPSKPAAKPTAAAPSTTAR